MAHIHHLASGDAPCSRRGLGRCELPQRRLARTPQRRCSAPLPWRRYLSCGCPSAGVQRAVLSLRPARRRWRAVGAVGRLTSGGGPVPGRGRPWRDAAAGKQPPAGRSAGAWRRHGRASRGRGRRAADPAEQNRARAASGWQRPWAGGCRGHGDIRRCFSCPPGSVCGHPDGARYEPLPPSQRSRPGADWGQRAARSQRRCHRRLGGGAKGDEERRGGRAPPSQREGGGGC
mmetsp:Transcript_32086/g.76253  ORF Transcript_32086/g.76253 Transcript_32086/m.76253 type:complete len:231 (+) Transcript_32086:1206-1898(+)